MINAKRYICGYRRGDGSVCQEPISFTVHYPYEGRRIRTRSCIKHVGKRVQRAVQCGGAQRVTVSTWQPAGNTELPIDAK